MTDMAYSFHLQYAIHVTLLEGQAMTT